MDKFYTETQEVKDAKEKETYRKALSSWITQERKNLDFTIHALVYIFTFSFLMSGVGFFFWYRRIQRYSDVKLRQEAKLPTKEV